MGFLLEGEFEQELAQPVLAAQLRVSRHLEEGALHTFGQMVLERQVPHIHVLAEATVLLDCPEPVSKSRLGMFHDCQHP